MNLGCQIYWLDFELERASMELHNQITPFQSKFHLHFPWIVCAFPRRRKMESPRQRWWSWTMEESRTTFWTREKIKKAKFQFSNFVLQPNRFGRQQYYFSVLSACDSNCQMWSILWQTVMCHKSRKQWKDRRRNYISCTYGQWSVYGEHNQVNFSMVARLLCSVRKNAINRTENGIQGYESKWRTAIIGRSIEIYAIDRSTEFGTNR